MTNKGLKKYWQLFWHFRKLMLMQMMAYRNDFFFWSFVSVMWTAFNFFFFRLLIGVNDSIAGWSEMELYLVVATYTILDAFTWGWFAPNMMRFRRMIYSGQLSDLLIRPISTTYLLLVHRNSYDNVPRLFIGIFVLIWALKNLQIELSIVQIALFIALVLISLIFLYTGWFVTATIAFWFERIDNITSLMPSLRDIYQFPRSIYTGVASFIFTTLFPLALVTSLPSEALLGRENYALILYFLIFTLGFIIFAGWFYKISIKKYTSVGN